jgi:hypothetical protein
MTKEQLQSNIDEINTAMMHQWKIREDDMAVILFDIATKLWVDSRNAKKEEVKG